MLCAGASQTPRQRWYCVSSTVVVGQRPMAKLKNKRHFDQREKSPFRGSYPYEPLRQQDYFLKL